MKNTSKNLNKFTELSTNEMNHIKGGSIIIVIEEDLGDPIKERSSQSSK